MHFIGFLIWLPFANLNFTFLKYLTASGLRIPVLQQLAKFHKAQLIYRNFFSIFEMAALPCWI